jgi:hypothetical protein
MLASIAPVHPSLTLPREAAAPASGSGRFPPEYPEVVMRNAEKTAMDSRQVASIAFLQSYREGRPLDELAKLLPLELEATGQREAAAIVRSFFSVEFLQALPQKS